MSYQASDMRGYSYEVITLADTGGKMEESSFLTESSTEAETRLAAAEQETKIQLEVAGEGESTSALLALAAPRAGEKPQSDIAAADGSYTGTVTYQPGMIPLPLIRSIRHRYSLRPMRMVFSGRQHFPY